MSRVVRSSKFRHVHGEIDKYKFYDDVKLVKTAWDSSLSAANNKFFAMCWGVNGGGAAVVLPYSKMGTKIGNGPMITGHKAHVLDLDFNPFNENLLATASEDCYIKLWKVPDEGLTENLTDAAQVLKGHKRKVGTVNFHPTAANILTSSSQDYLVKVWDIVKGEAVYSLEGATDLVQSVTWSQDGATVACTCKDKKLRFGDPRTGGFEATWDSHKGVKGARAVFLNDGKLFTVGFGRTSERQYAIWDPRGDTSKPLVQSNIDQSSGVLHPYYDADTSMIYLAGKGDGNIRYYEYTGEDKLIYYLSEFKSNTPGLGGCWLPKTACDVNSVEVARYMKIQDNKGTHYVQPISFKVPRKSDLFQDDLYPETSNGAGLAGLQQDEWFAGKNAPAGKVSLENGFTPKTPREEPEFEKKEDEGPKTEAELRKAYEEAQKRITYLESEVQKLTIKLKELEAK